MGLNTGAVGQGQGSTSHYGHADYARDKAAGISDAELLSKIHADPSKMGNGGVGGDLYNQIARNANSGSSANSSSNSGGGGYGGSYGGSVSHRDQKMAGSKEFQQNLNEATEAYRPEEVDMSKYEGLGQDFREGIQQEQAIKETDPFGDSWNSIDFFGKHLTMGREAQKGRGDASGIANKYIFNAAQTNPVDIAALDKKIRTNPLYSESKAELSNLKTYGDTYANSQNPVNWVQPQSPSAYEPPDFDKMYDKAKDDISGISI
jgi:hypothetical protein